MKITIKVKQKEKLLKCVANLLGLRCAPLLQTARQADVTVVLSWAKSPAPPSSAPKSPARRRRSLKSRSVVILSSLPYQFPRPPSPAGKKAGSTTKTKTG